MVRQIERILFVALKDKKILDGKSCTMSSLDDEIEALEPIVKAQARKIREMRTFTRRLKSIQPYGAIWAIILFLMRFEKQGLNNPMIKLVYNWIVHMKKNKTNVREMLSLLGCSSSNLDFEAFFESMTVFKMNSHLPNCIDRRTVLIAVINVLECSPQRSLRSSLAFLLILDSTALQSRRHRADSFEEEAQWTYTGPEIELTEMETVVDESENVDDSLMIVDINNNDCQ